MKPDRPDHGLGQGLRALAQMEIPPAPLEEAQNATMFAGRHLSAG